MVMMADMFVYIYIYICVTYIYINTAYDSRLSDYPVSNTSWGCKAEGRS